MAGLPLALLDKIRGAMLAREVFGWITQEPAGAEFFQLLCQAAQQSLAKAAQGTFASETILFDFDGTILGRASEDSSVHVPAISIAKRNR
jgi:cobalamin biosynthesis protein CbiD